MTIRDLAQLSGDYINTTLVRKLGHYIHSLISQKHFEREVERESGSRGIK